MQSPIRLDVSCFWQLLRCFVWSVIPCGMQLITIQSGLHLRKGEKHAIPCDIQTKSRLYP